MFPITGDFFIDSHILKLKRQSESDLTRKPVDEKLLVGMVCWTGQTGTGRFESGGRHKNVTF